MGKQVAFTKINKHKKTLPDYHKISKKFKPQASSSFMESPTKMSPRMNRAMKRLPDDLCANVPVASSTVIDKPDDISTALSSGVSSTNMDKSFFFVPVASSTLNSRDIRARIACQGQTRAELTKASSKKCGKKLREKLYTPMKKSFSKGFRTSTILYSSIKNVYLKRHSTPKTRDMPPAVIFNSVVSNGESSLDFEEISNRIYDDTIFKKITDLNASLEKHMKADFATKS